MKVRKLAAPVGAAAVMISIAASTLAPASAANTIRAVGQQETLNDHVTGAPMIGYTVSDLSPSSDTMPYPVNGRLYEATVTVEALGGWATPLIPLFNARAENGQNYRVLADGPQSLSGAAVRPGGSSTGKLYFDVVGDDPNSVAWVSNIRAHPNVAVEIGSDPSKAVVAHELPRDERDRIYAIVVQRAPGFADYEKQTDRVIPSSS